MGASHFFVDFICEPIESARMRTFCRHRGIYGRPNARTRTRGAGKIDFAKCDLLRRWRIQMNEFWLLAIIVIYFLAVTLLYKEPKQSYYGARRESNEASGISSDSQWRKHGSPIRDRKGSRNEYR